MVWNIEDVQGFQQCNSQNIGQINPNDSMGRYIKEYIQKNDVKTILEIGTWNGLGSTKCIIEGILSKETTEPIKFFSLETNTDKCDFAKQYWEKTLTNENKKKLNLEILNGSIVGIDEIKDKLPSFFTEMKTAGLDVNEFFFNIDIDNMKTSKIFNPLDFTEHFDLVILDGSDYFTYFEYEKVKDITTFFICDDKRTIKTQKIYRENKDKLIKDEEDRNGWFAFKQ